MRIFRLARMCLTFVLFAVGCSEVVLADKFMPPAEVVPLVSKFCVHTNAKEDQALKMMHDLKLKSYQAKISDMGMAKMFSLRPHENYSVDLTIKNSGPVFSCYISFYLTDVATTFLKLQKQFSFKGRLVDYVAGGKLSPFVVTTPNGVPLVATLDVFVMKNSNEGKVSMMFLLEPSR